MKQIYVWGAALSVMALASCSKYEEVAPAAKVEGQKMELQADLSQSRTVAEGYATKWVAGDAMKVWIGEEAAYTNCGEFILSEENYEAGLFTGTMPAGYDNTKSYDWYAVYPYESANYEAAGTPAKMTMLVGTNIQRQMGGYNSIAHISGSVAPLYGVVKGAAAGSRPQVQMKHLSSLVKIVVTNIGEEPLQVAKIAVESQKTALAGRAAVTLTNGEPVFAPVAAASNQVLLRVGTGQEEVEIDPIAKNGTAEFYVAVIPFTAPAEGERLEVSIIDLNGNICTRSFTIPAGTAFKAGEVNTLNVKYEATTATDLSAEGTANCYIVSQAGDYKFKATQGNSDTRPDIATADWLWMSESNDLISNVRYVDGYVYFKAGEKKGNAVIAGLTTKDAISWSWHIWLTDAPALHYGATTAQQIMDRNLGATSTAVDDYKAYGLCYEWGRKDPFPGANNTGAVASESTAYQEATIKFEVNPALGRTFNSTRNTNATSGQEVAYSITNPMCYLRYYNADNGGGKNNWWNSDYADFTNLWGFVAEGQQVNKTIYDPCPAGYAVPGYLDDVYGSYTTLTTTFTPVGTMNGRMYTGAEGSTSYYPAAGFRDVGTPLKEIGVMGQYWTAYPRAKSTDFRTLKFSSSNVESSRTNSAYGNSVRCVKINQ